MMLSACALPAAPVLHLQDRYKGRLYATWRPDLGLVKYRVWEEVPKTTPSNPPETPAAPTRAGAVKPENVT